MLSMTSLQVPEWAVRVRALTAKMEQCAQEIATLSSERRELLRAAREAHKPSEIAFLAGLTPQRVAQILEQKAS